MFRRTICALTAWAALAGRAPAESPEADPPKGKTATAAEPAPPDRKPARPAERPGTAAPAARLGSLSPGVVPTGYRQAKAEPPPSDAPPKSTQLPDPRPVPQTAPPSGPAYVPAPPEMAYPAGPACAGCAQYGGHAGDGRVWARYEWLEWTTSGQHLPPSITTTPLGAAEAGAGALSTPGTVVLFPHDRVNNEFRGGFRMYLGYCFDDDRQQTLGIR